MPDAATVPSATTRISSAIRTVEKLAHQHGDRAAARSGAASLAGERFEQDVLGGGIETGGGLVEHQERRVVAHHGPAKRHLLPLPPIAAPRHTRWYAEGVTTVVLVSRRVLIVQHAEKQRLPGNPGINPVGAAQAKATAALLTDHEEIVAVWASPMRRAIETADPIARMTGHPLVAEARLRERMNWDGPSVESLGDFLDDWQRASVDRDYLPRSGESSRAAGDRFIEALGDLVATYGQGTAAVVAHGGVTIDALRTLLGDDVLWNESPGLIRDGVPSCAITTLAFDGHRWELERLASVDHLVVCGE